MLGDSYAPKPCPTCGRCPACGQCSPSYPYMPLYPHDTQPSPWWQIPPVTYPNITTPWIVHTTDTTGPGTPMTTWYTSASVGR